ncbi:MAG: lasso peptide biosynthesis B2 protein [Gaiellaceae bacterium]
MKPARLANPGAWRGAFWAGRAVLQARRQLQRGHLADVSIEPPYRLPATAGMGVHAVLRRLPSSCLERAIVLQRWRTAQGDPREIVIGVLRDENEFKAHAWVDGDGDQLAPAFEELMRVPATPAR